MKVCGSLRPVTPDTLEPVTWVVGKSSCHVISWQLPWPGFLLHYHLKRLQTVTQDSEPAETLHVKMGKCCMYHERLRHQGPTINYPVQSTGPTYFIIFFE